MYGKFLLNAIVMVVILGVLCACAFTAAPVNNDWQVYENEAYGYSLRFPEECTFGPMPQDCKQPPPKERSEGCLCFLNAENPREIILQAFLGEDELTLAGFTIAHYETPLYNPPSGTDLVEWLQESFSERLLNVPDDVNAEIGGVPAVRITTPSSPMAVSLEDIFVLSAGRLLQVRMTDVDTEINRQFYDQLLSTLIFLE